MKHTHVTCTFQEQDIARLVDKLRPLIDAASVVTITGSLGAGKTTLVRELLRAYGITEGITSPTFTYVNMYRTDTGEQLYHFDLYRIQSLDEFIVAGFDEYLYKENSKVFIEWPEKILSLLHKDVCMISLEYIDHDTRRCTGTYYKEFHEGITDV
jgi:tRNA threonylcarbamoyladenosine biosynthesis protein TsaE